MVLNKHCNHQMSGLCRSSAVLWLYYMIMCMLIIVLFVLQLLFKGLLLKWRHPCGNNRTSVCEQLNQPYSYLLNKGIECTSSGREKKRFVLWGWGGLWRSWEDGRQGSQGIAVPPLPREGGCRCSVAGLTRCAPPLQGARHPTFRQDAMAPLWAWSGRAHQGTPCRSSGQHSHPSILSPYPPQSQGLQVRRHPGWRSMASLLPFMLHTLHRPFICGISFLLSFVQPFILFSSCTYMLVWAYISLISHENRPPLHTPCHALPTSLLCLFPVAYDSTGGVL